MLKQQIDYLILDMSNILYRAYYANKNETDLLIAGLANHTALMVMNKYFKMFNPSKGIVACFDKPNWRVDYTTSPQCISKKRYKGNRRQKMTPSEKQKYENFLEHISEFETLLRDYTSVKVLAGEKLEADDLIMGCVQYVNEINNNVSCVVVSSDKDLLQVLRYPNTQLFDPASGKQRDLTEWNNDVDLFMFEKCLRGDRGDNVMSAYPRLRKTRILTAYEDEFEYTNIMNHTWGGESNDEFTVKQLFNENRLLMDLTKQPDDIKKRIFTTIIQTFQSPGKYNHFEFIKFCGKYEMKKVIAGISQYITMLSR